MEFPHYGGGNFLLGAGSAVRLPESKCKTTLRLDPLGVGKDITLKDGVIQADHLCTLDESGEEKLISLDRLPRCYQGWQATAISLDRHSLLISCFEESSFLDAFYHLSKASLQVVDSSTLTPRAAVQLSTRRRSTYAVFHRSGTTMVAVLEDGASLKLYNIAD